MDAAAAADRTVAVNPASAAAGPLADLAAGPSDAAAAADRTVAVSLASAVQTVAVSPASAAAGPSAAEAQN